MSRDRRPAPADGFHAAMDRMAAAGLVTVTTYKSFEEAIEAGVAADKAEEEREAAENPAIAAKRIVEDRIPPHMRPDDWDQRWAEMEAYCEELVPALTTTS